MRVYSTRIVVLIAVLFHSCTSTQEKSGDHQEKATIQDVEDGIRANIAARTKAGEGYFQLQSDSLDLNLKLVRVHTEYLSVLGPSTFFACVDLATTNGDVYDVDFFLKGTRDSMQVTRTELHKLNGKPYYTWKQAENKTWFTVPVKNASNDLLGVVEAEDQFEFTYEVLIPELSEPAEMWVPIAQNDPYQDIEITSLWAPGEQKMLQEEVYGNTILYLQLQPEHGQKTISITYQVRRREKAPYTDSNTDMQKYLEEAPYLPVGGRFADIARKTIQKRAADTPLTQARALYDYIIDNMRYAKQGVYGTGDANYACDVKSGNCTEFHSFFISLARSAGIPARFAVGAAIPSERNEGGVNGYHCWAEFFAEGKWWPVDISEANKYTPLATYYFGHHPANRIEFSRGRNLLPDPAPASDSINFLAYPILEQDGKPIDVKTTFTFKRGNRTS